MVPELGSLRNCLVHHEGNLLSKDKGGQLFKDTLTETLRFLDLNEMNNQIISLNENDFVNKVIFDLQDFVALAGGRVHRKMEYNNERK